MSGVQHIVMVKFPRELSAHDIEWMRQLLARWPQEIGGIRSQHWGFDTSGRSRGYQWGLVMEFESPEAAAHYHPHPLHQEFAQWVASEGGEVLAFDFPLSDLP